MSKSDITTRSQFYADSDENTVRRSRRIVRNALEQHCVGRENAMAGTDLAELTPLKYTTVRDIVAELRDDPEGPPVGNCGQGYFVIETPDELEDWLDTKRGEIETARSRMQANTRAFNRRRSE